MTTLTRRSAILVATGPKDTGPDPAHPGAAQHFLSLAAAAGCLPRDVDLPETLPLRSTTVSRPMEQSP